MPQYRGALLQPLERVAAFAQNGLEVLRYGGLNTGEEPAPFEVVERSHMYRLRRYFPTSETPGAPVLLVHPMMLSAELWDVSPATSAVAALHEAGLDPWVVDFGSPDREEGGLERTLSDHVVALDEIVELVATRTGRSVHLSGYCQGGLFCYLAAAYRRSRDIESLITFGSPADFSKVIPSGLPTEILTKPAELLAEHVFPHVSIPPWAARLGFNSMDPIKTARAQFDFIRQLHDRQALIGRERQRRFMTWDAYVGWSGPAIVELLSQFIATNRMMTGGFVITERAVTLADIHNPVLAFVGEMDDIGKPDAVRGIGQAMSNAEVYELTLRAGHLGLVLGSAASSTTWPAVIDWIRWREGEGQKPVRIRPMPAAPPDIEDTASVSDRAGYALNQVSDIGVRIGRGVLGKIGDTLRISEEITSEAVRVLPRLLRLGKLQDHSRVSLGAVLAEQAEHNPTGEFLLFDDRAHTHRAIGQRIDNVVRGLVHTGIRRGDHVGVLMETRPSALVAVAALSRIGAVAVLLPTDAATEALELTPVRGIVVDPDNAAAVAGSGRQLLVLGGGEARPLPPDLGSRVVDLEQLDPEQMPLPRWYQPNPGTAGDLAFVVFSGGRDRPTPRFITNRRWALSAFGTASVASLTKADTVFCIAPLRHPSGLLTTIGGALVGGSRIALTNRFDPARFDEEVRRYGVTVVSYTWAMLRDLVSEPVSGSRRLPIRMFLGSGMPVEVWNRVADRFAPARIVELWATTEGDAVLANVSGAKPGAKGRPLPGTADIELAAFDAESGSVRTDEYGYVVRCTPGEVGLLLAKPRGAAHASSRVMRDVFRPGDLWLASEDLFRQDADGDFWLVDNLHRTIRTERGPVFTQPISDALGQSSQFDLVAVYGVPDGACEKTIAAVALRPKAGLSAEELDTLVADLAPDQRPDLIAVVDSIPLTKSYRPDLGLLRSGDVTSEAVTVWRYDRTSDSYRPSDAG